jgi:hypothetical protein
MEEKSNTQTGPKLRIYANTEKPLTINELKSTLMSLLHQTR